MTAVSAKKNIVTSLGSLRHLIGTWSGSTGWNIIAVPDRHKKFGYKVIVQPIIETITFSPIGGSILNRGFDHNKEISGLSYQIQVSDAETNQALHFENGMWLELYKNRVARLASIPHGDTALLIGDSFTIKEEPEIDTSLSPLPDDLDPRKNKAYLQPYFDKQEEFEGRFNVLNPNKNLSENLEGKEVSKTLVFDVSTANKGGVQNIPFITKHANVPLFESTYYLEDVRDKKTGKTFQQLQYTQTTIIEFQDNEEKPGQKISWPHIDINTLIKQ